MTTLGVFIASCVWNRNPEFLYIGTIISDIFLWCALVDIFTGGS